MQDHETFHYQSYILRLWQERPASPERLAVWRFSLEDARGGERRGFGSVEELASFLRQCMQGTSDDRRER